MYELKNGSSRIVSTLKNATDSDIKRLAEILNYIPEQLEEDILALNDIVEIGLSAINEYEKIDERENIGSYNDMDELAQQEHDRYSGDKIGY